MKKVKCLFLLLILTLVSTACSSKRDILYLQESTDNFNVEYKEYELQPDDILKITFNGVKPSVALGYSNENLSTIPSTLDVMKLDGFKINSEGFISITGIGEVLVAGSTILDLTKKMKNIVLERGLLMEPSIDIKLLNASFTIIGDVAMPGRYNFLKNNLNIFEAIGMAGDLNITGKRSDVKLIRTMNNGKNIFNLNLTKLQSINSNFQVFSGDIILVNPNSTKIKSAGIIGNSGTLLSLLTFLLSSVILLTNS